MFQKVLIGRVSETSATAGRRVIEGLIAFLLV